ncbi:MAG: hypothetical protein OXC40_01285, partial [Proteobacteria bacterium]|nr:hypothetical protein [Pseudomonadota bacterium]
MEEFALTVLGKFLIQTLLGAVDPWHLFMAAGLALILIDLLSVGTFDLTALGIGLILSIFFTFFTKDITTLLWCSGGMITFVYVVFRWQIYHRLQH